MHNILGHELPSSWPDRQRKSHLRFSMNQDINVKIFLESNDLLDLCLDGFNVIILRDPDSNSTTKALINTIETRSKQ